MYKSRKKFIHFLKYWYDVIQRSNDFGDQKVSDEPLKTQTFGIVLKGRGFLFHAVVLAGTLQSTDFKSIYSNQFKRYEYIQGIWEMQNYMKNTMTKNFWRARTSARAGRIFCFLGQNLMIFESSQQDEVWRAPRAQVRAHPKFFH